MSRLQKAAVLAAIIVFVGAAGGIFGWATLVDVAQQREALYQGDPVHGLAQPWQFNFLTGHSPVQRELYALHNLLFFINLAICALVAVLLLYVVWRFRASRHPGPSHATHNVPLEIAWTVLPVIVLVIIAIPSTLALYRVEGIPEADVTLKVTGHQWYWDYEYPDHGGIQISSNRRPDKELPEQDRAMRLLAVDNVAVLPAHTIVRIQLTAGDVVHSFALPSLGIKRDAVPGRLTEIWTRIESEGLHVGQCSELCGRGHAYMPIAIKAVSPKAFEAWARRTSQSAEASPGKG